VPSSSQVSTITTSRAGTNPSRFQRAKLATSTEAPA
jgi:hypothetical protein